MTVRVASDRACTVRFCFRRYNAILRGSRPELTNDFLRSYLSTVCKGNLYPTTLHYMCLGIDKLSKLTQAAPVYRAPGGRLPRSFFSESEYGFRGGVEMGFMSTSTDKHAAMEYAAGSGMPLIFEVQQGLVARGANVAWLSQFPAESEVLFGPLTSLEVYRIRSDGAYTTGRCLPVVASTTKFPRWLTSV